MTVAAWTAWIAAARAGAPDPIGHEPLAEVGLAAAILGSGALRALPQGRSGWAPDRAISGDPAMGPVGTAVAFGGVAATVAGSALASGGSGGRRVLAAAIVAEGAVLSFGLAQVPKRLAGRCRPDSWDPATGRCDPGGAHGDDAYAAFWSGHTSIVSGAAGAAACLAGRDRAVGPVVVAASAEIAAVVTGGLRVAAGEHSWTDVAAAFAVGNALGVATCAIHPSGGPTRVSVAVGPGTLTVRGRF